MRFVLVNPNTSSATTELMLRIARETAPALQFDGLTASAGAPFIASEVALAEAARSVENLLDEIRKRAPAGVIVAAFGDPGLMRLRERLACPVIGIGEASMAEAASGGRRFAVATTTPGLAASIRNAADAYGHRDQFCGVALTAGDPAFVMADSDRLEKALRIACEEAIDALGAEAVVIGGGPLALAARALRRHFAIPIIEPIPAAVRLAAARAGA